MTPSCTTKRLSKPLDRKVLSGKSACARITQVSQITGFKKTILHLLTKYIYQKCGNQAK